MYLNNRVPNYISNKYFININNHSIILQPKPVYLLLIIINSLNNDINWNFFLKPLYNFLTYMRNYNGFSKKLFHADLKSASATKGEYTLSSRIEVTSSGLEWGNQVNRYYQTLLQQLYYRS